MYEKISKDHNFKNTFLLTEKKLYSHWCIMEISKSSNSYISRVCNAIFFGYCVFRGQSKNLSFWAFYSTMSWIIKMPLFLDQFLFCFNLFFRRFFGRTEENAFTKNFRRFYKRRWEFHDDLRITFFCCESCIHMLGNARLVLLQRRLGERELIWFCNYKCEIFLRQKSGETCKEYLKLWINWEIWFRLWKWRRFQLFSHDFKRFGWLHELNI